MGFNSTLEVIETVENLKERKDSFRVLKELLEIKREADKLSIDSTPELYKEIQLKDFTVFVFTRTTDCVVLIRTKSGKYVFKFDENTLISKALLDKIEEHGFSVSEEALTAASIKYKLDIDERFWVSTNGRILAGSKVIKPGKILMELTGAEGYELDALIDELKSVSIDLNKSTFYEVEELYKSDKLKIKSCMTKKNKDLSLYSKLPVKALGVPDSNGNIIARTLIWEDKYYDRIYSTNKALAERFKAWLNTKYRPISKVRYKTDKIKLDIKDVQFPYMDSVDIITVESDGFIMSNYTIVEVYVATRTDGDLNEYY